MGTFFTRPIGALVVALGIGLVIGAERERRKAAASPQRLVPGIRTFALVSMLGAVVALLASPALLAIVAAGVAGFAATAYLLGDRADASLTTEVAFLATYCLGAYAVRDPMTALAGGLTAAALLALRTELHAWVRSVLSEHELHDALLFGIAAVVVLPLLPNRAVDPMGVINPFRLWRLVVLFMAMSGAGYIAQRAIGPRYGLALAGFGSGFVSSAATVATMGARARGNAQLAGPAVAGATASSAATLVQLAILVGAANVALLERLAWPLVAGELAALGYAGVQTLRIGRTEAEPDRGHAFKLTTALFFAGFVALLSVVTTFAERASGGTAVLVANALAGLVDAHSPAAAIASVSASDRLADEWAVVAVLLAVTTNTVTKAVLAVSARSRPFTRGVLPGLGLMLAAMWIAYALAR